MTVNISVKDQTDSKIPSDLLQHLIGLLYFYNSKATSSEIQQHSKLISCISDYYKNKKEGEIVNVINLHVQKLDVEVLQLKTNVGCLSRAVQLKQQELLLKERNLSIMRDTLSIVRQYL